MLQECGLRMVRGQSLVSYFFCGVAQSPSCALEWGMTQALNRFSSRDSGYGVKLRAENARHERIVISKTLGNFQVFVNLNTLYIIESHSDLYNNIVENHTLISISLLFTFTGLTLIKLQCGGSYCTTQPLSTRANRL